MFLRTLDLRQNPFLLMQPSALRKCHLLAPLNTLQCLHYILYLKTKLGSSMLIPKETGQVVWRCSNTQLLTEGYPTEEGSEHGRLEEVKRGKNVKEVTKRFHFHTLHLNCSTSVWDSPPRSVPPSCSKQGLLKSQVTHRPCTQVPQKLMFC